MKEMLEIEESMRQELATRQLTFGRPAAACRKKHRSEDRPLQKRESAQTAPPLQCSFVGAQLFAAGFGQQQDGENHNKVGAGGERRDGMAQTDACAEKANKRRKQCADAAPEIIGKTLARATQTAGKQLSEKRAHGAERARGKESQGKTQNQH